MTPYNDPRNIKRRVFYGRFTCQGGESDSEEWEVDSQNTLEQFRAEILAQFTAHLDACLSNGRWAFTVDSYEPKDS